MRPARFSVPLAVEGRFICVDCGIDLGDAMGRQRPIWCWDCAHYRYRVLAQVQSRASAALTKAVRNGDVPPVNSLICVDCSAPASCYDHRDYTRPLHVVPVCKACNAIRGSADNWGDLPERIAHPPAYARHASAIAGPAINRVIDYVGSAAELARRLAIPQQHVQTWRRRGWASPMHVLSLEPFLPPSVTLRDLLIDHRNAQSHCFDQAAEAA